jgi:CRP/FNR family transcriptional regulator, anaerobic regulatory protein
MTFRSGPGARVEEVQVMGAALPNVVNINANARTAACRQCDLDGVCDAVRRNCAVPISSRRSAPLNRGDHLFRQGEVFSGLYVVRAGSMKTCTMAPDGVEQVVRFHMPGEVLGLDGLCGAVYHASAAALEMSSVCRISSEDIDHLLSQSPGSARDLLGLAGREMVAEQARIALVGQRAADARLAAFLIGLSNEYRRRGYSALEFNLSMSRQDIANYLSMAVETVSRLFTQFSNEGVIDVERRRIRIRQMDCLRAMIGQPAQAAAG